MSSEKRVDVLADLPKLVGGYNRQWVKCRKCGTVAFYDYIPYSLSSSLTEMPCRHDIGMRLYEAAVAITEEEAYAALANIGPTP